MVRKAETDGALAATCGNLDRPCAHRDAEDLRRVAEHQEIAAFERLFGRYAPRVSAFFRGRGLPHAQADDLAQETMVRVWRGARLYQPGRATPSAWIYAIARNLWIDSLRRPIPSAHAAAVLLQASADADADQAETPAEAYEARERIQRVRAALQNVTAEQFAVIYLAFYGGFSHERIAETLSLPLGTVKSRLRLAFGKLRGALGSP